MTDKSAEGKGPYKVLPDVDSGGWWVNGPGDIHTLPKWAPPAKEIAEIICAGRNEAYAAGRASREGLKKALEGSIKVLGKAESTINVECAKWADLGDNEDFSKRHLQISGGALGALSRVFNEALAEDEKGE